MTLPSNLSDTYFGGLHGWGCDEMPTRKIRLLFVVRRPMARVPNGGDGDGWVIWERPATFPGWVFFLISLGGQAPHVLRAHMWALTSCGGPNEIELTPQGLIYRSLCAGVHAHLLQGDTRLAQPDQRLEARA